MIKFAKIGLIFIIVEMLISCNNEYQSGEKRINGNLIKGKFSKEGYIDGVAKYYDSLNRLISVIVYDKGFKNGPATSYYTNGILKDSANYVMNQKNGYYYQFDSIGNISYINYCYYGLIVGPMHYYKDGKLWRFLFNDFGHTPLVACNFASDTIKDIEYFKMSPTISDGEKDGKKIKIFFAYLPMIPGVSQDFMIGISKGRGQDIELKKVVGVRNFIDTILSVPEQGWHYYISCHIQVKSQSLNKLFLEEIVD